MKISAITAEFCAFLHINPTYYLEFFTTIRIFERADPSVHPEGNTHVSPKVAVMYEWWWAF